MDFCVVSIGCKLTKRVYVCILRSALAFRCIPSVNKGLHEESSTSVKEEWKSSSHTERIRYASQNRGVDPFLVTLCIVGLAASDIFFTGIHARETQYNFHSVPYSHRDHLIKQCASDQETVNAAFL